MACVFNLPEDKRFCDFCSAWCGDRRLAIQIRTSSTGTEIECDTDTSPIDTFDG